MFKHAIIACCSALVQFKEHIYFQIVNYYIAFSGKVNGTEKNSNVPPESTNLLVLLFYMNDIAYNVALY